MSISSAMQTGVSGLLANSTAVESISNNIANANTTGYRRSFAQMVTATTQDLSSTPGNNVYAIPTLDMSEGAGANNTGVATDMSISGSGFFVVSGAPNDPNIANYVLTRAGSFTPDVAGNLRNTAGFYLAGYAYGADGSLGSVDQNSFASLSTVNISAGLSPGSASTQLSISGNLPAQETGVITPAQPFISSAEFFSPLGQADRLQFAWQPTSTANQWDLSIADASGNSYGTVTANFNDSGANAGSVATYSGATSTAIAPANFAFNTATGVATLTVNNGTTPQVIDVTVGAPNTFTGMTQFAGDYTTLKVTNDGSASGTLRSTTIDESGNLFGVYSNGDSKPIFNIPLANVANPLALTSVHGNTFLLTRASGEATLGTAGTGSTGSIASGALENSNVSIAQELTDLIRVQRAYSTNAKIITTVDQMLDETTRLKR